VVLPPGAADSPFPSHWAYMGVYDGHGGSLTVDFLMHNLHVAIATAISGLPSNVKRAVEKAFSSVDKVVIERETALFNSDSLGNLGSGATACVGLVNTESGLLYVANAGDCRAVLYETGTEKERFRVRALSRDHQAKTEGERQRIEAAGGSVVNDRIEGMLEVSRAFGDVEFKEIGLISTPELTRYEFTMDSLVKPCYLVIGCDGLWNYMDEQAIGAMLACLEEKRGMDDVGEVEAETVKRAVAKALQEGSDDNISIVVVRIEAAT